MKTQRIILSIGCALLLAAGCQVETDSLEETRPVVDSSVSFNAYINRSTKAGYQGMINTSVLESEGFGVFAYQTDDAGYFPGASVPDFMYNQMVTKGTVWEYTPVKYWPNQDDARVSFFAYAPWVEVDSGTGNVTSSGESGIVSVRRNSAAGDPLVRYVSSLVPAERVDLCWANPMLNQERPASVSDPKVSMQFHHALASLNLLVDAYVDGDDDTNELATETRIWLRSVRFEGFTTQGSLDLNQPYVINTNPAWNEPYSDAPVSSTAIRLLDGRADGLEAASPSPNERPLGLNPQLVQQYTYGSALDVAEEAAGNTKLGVYNSLRNLFDDSSATEPLYVIPTDRPLRITLSYDIETQSPALPGYLADGVTHGISVPNEISSTVTVGGIPLQLTAGMAYTVRLHLGVNSVQIAATVNAWGDQPDLDDLEIPMDDLPVNQIMLNVYVNPWDEQPEVALSVPMSELRDLSTYFKPARTGDEDISSRYIGLNVDKDGNIEGEEGTEYDGNSVGRIVYISTNGTDVDSSRPGSRILVLATKEDFGETEYMWCVTTQQKLEGYTDVTALNGATFTATYYNENDGNEPPAYYYPAAHHAYAFNSDKTLQLAGATGWFLPSKQQMMLIGCNDGSATGMAGAMGLGTGTFWCATEQDANTARCYHDGVWEVDPKETVHKVRPMFAY